MHEEVAIRSTGTLEERVSALLLQLRVPVHLSGYRFIRQAILLALAEPTLLDCVTYALYPAVAARYGTSASCVERAIRHGHYRCLESRRSQPVFGNYVLPPGKRG